VLNWGTAQEKDNSHFEIEKSADGRNWKNMAVVFGNGTTNDAHNYSYTDRSENGNSGLLSHPPGRYRWKRHLFNGLNQSVSGEAKSDAHIFVCFEEYYKC
jgi:hypothetical protein